jgi:hypothetical protein
MEYAQSSETFLFAQLTAALGINNQADETLGIMIELKSHLRLPVSLNRCCHSGQMVEALL